MTQQATNMRLQSHTLTTKYDLANSTLICGEIKDEYNYRNIQSGDSAVTTIEANWNIKHDSSTIWQAESHQSEVCPLSYDYTKGGEYAAMIHNIVVEHLQALTEIAKTADYRSAYFQRVQFTERSQEFCLESTLRFGRTNPPVEALRKKERQEADEVMQKMLIAALREFMATSHTLVLFA